MATNPQAIMEELEISDSNHGYGAMLVVGVELFDAERLNEIMDLGDTGDGATWHIAAPSYGLPYQMSQLEGSIEAYLDYRNKTTGDNYRAEIIYYGQGGVCAPIATSHHGDQDRASVLTFKVYVGMFWPKLEFGDWTRIMEAFTGIQGIDQVIYFGGIEKFLVELKDDDLDVLPMVVVRPGPRGLGYVANGIRLMD